MPIDAVVFDLDNTLCRHDADIDAVYRQAFDSVAVEPFGEPDDLWTALDGSPDPDDRVGYLGAGFARVAAQYGRSEADPVDLATALLDGFDDSAVAFLPGAEAALDAARRHGPVAILTNGPRERQRPKIRSLAIENAVDAIVYAGDLPRRKPHVEPFDLVLEDLGVRAGRTVYVGDSLKNDVAGAHNAGLKAAWLRPDGEETGRYRPEYELDSLAELHAILTAE
ncbi:HAD family hydrolase [Halobellus sp. Atlit-31R]|nr:HAD family hydrolase [Halobellus sp. Atlit-31R]